MKKVRFAVIGVANMGGVHARNIVNNGGSGCCLTAVADIVPQVARKVGCELSVPCFTDIQKMYESGLCDAVIIATPHYWHPSLTISAARAKLHVLCEKPLASSVGPARAMIAECRKCKVALGTMLQQRTRGVMMKVKQTVDSGRIGGIFRIQMICSHWFRTQKYYDSGTWRGTWNGEGGGVLINQAPHNLDLFQWIGGMPKRVTAVLGTRAHNIEVEDTAEIICEYDNGGTGHIYTTTAEQPGCEQLMIAGDKGTLIVEDGKIRLARLKIPVGRHITDSRSALSGAEEQEITWREVPHRTLRLDGDHINVIRAFARHIRTGSPMVACGDEGINELELSNAAYISSYRNKRVDLPVDAAEMDRLLAALERKHSTGRGKSMRKIATRRLNALLRGE